METWPRSRLIRGRAGCHPICALPCAVMSKVYCTDSSAVALLSSLPIAFDLHSDHLSQFTWNPCVSTRMWLSCKNETTVTVTLFFSQTKPPKGREAGAAAAWLSGPRLSSLCFTDLKAWLPAYGLIWLPGLQLLQLHSRKQQRARREEKGLISSL